MQRALTLSLAEATSRVDVLDRLLLLLEASGVHAVIFREERGELTLIAHRLPAPLQASAQSRLGRPLVDLKLGLGDLPFAAAVSGLGVPALARPGVCGPFELAAGGDGGPVGAALGWSAGRVAVVAGRTGPDRRAVLVAFGPNVGRWLLPVLESAAAHVGFAWRIDTRARSQLDSAAATPTGEHGFRLGVELDAAEAVLCPIVRLADRVTVGLKLSFAFAGAEGSASLGDVIARQSPPAGRSGAAPRWSQELRRVLRARPTGCQIVVALHPAQVADPHGCLALVAHELGRLPVAERVVALDLGAAPAETVAHAVHALRQHDLTVEFTGVGSSSPELELLAGIRPDFVELAPAIAAQVTTNSTRRAVLGAILALGATLGVRVSAAGVDDETIAGTLFWLGVLHGCGQALGPAFQLGEGEPTGPFARLSPQELAVAASGRANGHPAASARGYHPPASAPGAAPGPIAVGPGPHRPDGGPGHPTDLARTLSTAALALQGEHDPDRILAVIADQLERLVPVDTLVIYAARLEDRRFRAVLTRGALAEAFTDHSFGLDQGLTGWAFALGRPFRVGDADAHPASLQMPGTPVVDESMILIPLIAGDHRLGMMNCTRTGLDRFTEADLETASLLGHMAAAAWRNAQLYAELTEFAITDALTGCFNTRWLREAGPRELAISSRDHRPLALVLLDLDRFKLLNDSAGHAAGDLALQQVGEALRAVIRAGDAAVRHGGEEFVLLLPGANGDGAERVLRAARAELAAIRLPPASALARITASAGVAVHPADGQTLNALLQGADRAMYLAKSAGGDRARRAGAAGPLPVAAGTAPGRQPTPWGAPPG